MDKPVLIFGGKSLGKAAIDIFKSNDVLIFGILDEDKSLHGKEIEDIPILSGTEDKEYLKVIGEKCDVFLAYDDNTLKKSLVKTLLKENKTMPVNAIHTSSSIAGTAHIHHGNLINSKASIGAFSEIGNHCIINSGAIIDYETKIEDYVQIGTGAIIGSNVHIEESTFIGSGAIIVNGVKIGKNARVGAGSLVINDIEEDTTVFGNPAKEVE